MIITYDTTQIWTRLPKRLPCLLFVPDPHDFPEISCRYRTVFLPWLYMTLSKQSIPGLISDAHPFSYTSGKQQTGLTRQDFLRLICVEGRIFVLPFVTLARSSSLMSMSVLQRSVVKAPYLC